jgi:photosystem II stability/assembly factor-like uncharacterized protein
MHTKYLIIAFFCLLCSLRLVHGQSKAQWLNPQPQGNLLLDLHVFDTNNILAVGRAGTMMQSTDGGLSWTVEHCYKNFTADFSAVSFATSNVGLIVGDSGTVLRTTNQGATWTRTNTGSTDYLQDIAHFNRDTAVTAGREICQTTDGGNTWNSVSSIPVRSLARLDEQTAIGISDGGTIARTTNAGFAWTPLRIARDAADLFAIRFLNSRIGFITGFMSSSDTTRGTFCMRTTDAGLTWHIRSSRGDFGIRALAVLDTSTLVTIGENGEAYRSTDAGISWLLQPTTSPLGSTVTSIAFFHSDSGFAVGNFGYIMRTIDGGRTWTELSQRLRRPYYFMEVSFLNRQVGNIVSAFGEIHRTTNGGDTWLRQTFDTTIFGFSATEPITETTAYAAGGYGAIIKTVNGGTTWVRQNSGTSELLTALDFVDENIGYVVGFEGAFSKTTNGGTTWRSLPISDHYFFDVAFADARRGLAVGYFGLILQTTDGGESWADRSYRFDQSFIYGVDFIDQETAVAVGSEGLIIRSTNGGMSWGRVASGSINYLFGVDFADEKNGIVVGDRGTILRTTNGGLSWSSLKSGTSNTLSSVSFVDSITAVIGGEGGTILRLRLDEPLSVENNNYTIPQSFELFQNYPNPFNPSTTIRFAIPQTIHAKLMIFDLLGRAVETLVDGVLSAGEHLVEWKPTDAASGIYFYRLQTPLGSFTKKLLLVR